MSAEREIQRNGELCLIGRIIGHSDHCTELEAAGRFRPTGSVKNGAAEGVHRVKVKGCRKHREPEFLNGLKSLRL